MTVWLNGELRDDDQIIDRADRGLLLADGVFETLLVKEGYPVFFERHMMRLRHAAGVMDIPLKYANDTIFNALRMLVSKAGCESGTASVRITLTRGPGGRGISLPAVDKIHPTLLVSVTEVPDIPQSIASLVLSSITRNENSPTANLKTLSYTDHILAKNAALDAGAEDAIMLNQAGDVTCVTIGNVFLIMPGGKILTPGTDAGILPGITRRVVLEICDQLGFPASESAVAPEMLKEADLFITNSLVGLRRASLITREERFLNEGSPEILLELQKHYAQKIDYSVKKWQSA